jgi:hypothetical protein
MATTVTRKRIEILVDAPLVRRLTAAADAAGVKGYTILPTLSGKGASGPWSEDHVSGAATKLLFMTVTNDAAAERLVAAIVPLLDTYGLVLTVGTVEVVRGERY